METIISDVLIQGAILFLFATVAAVGIALIYFVGYSKTATISGSVFVLVGLVGVLSCGCFFYPNNICALIISIVGVVIGTIAALCALRKYAIV